MPFGIQPIHIIIVIAVALIIFGPSKLPEMGRGLGKAITEFRKGTQEMAEGFKQEVNQPATPPTTAVPPAAVPPNAVPYNQTYIPPANQTYIPPAQTFVPPASVPVMSTQVCPQCQTANPINARFCNNCGAALSAPQQPQE